MRGGGLSPSSGLMCEIVNTVCRGNLNICWENVGERQEISKTPGCVNHNKVFATEN